MARKTYIAETDDAGNVLVVLETTRTAKAVIEDDANADRHLVEWDGHVPDEDAQTRKWTGSGWASADKKHVAAIEKARRDGLRQLERDRKTIAEAEAQG